MRLYPKTLSPLLLATSLTMVASLAVAQQPQCGPREAMISVLSKKHKEAPVMAGLAPNGRLVEVYGSVETGTWSIVVSSNNGMSCLVASGSKMTMLEQPPTDNPA